MVDRRTCPRRGRGRGATCRSASRGSETSRRRALTWHARTSYEAILASAKRLEETDPHHAEWQNDLVASYQRMMFVEAQSGDFAKARGHLKAALAVLDRLLANADGGAVVKSACQMRMFAAAIEEGAGDPAAAAPPCRWRRRAEARRSLATVDARGEFQGDAQLDEIREMLKASP